MATRVPSPILGAQVAEQLVRVRQIQSSRAAFAAIKDDGSVVTWGDPARGGDSSQAHPEAKPTQG